METISKTANVLITSIDRHFAEICRERGIDLTAQQAAMEAPQPSPELPDTPERFISDMLDMLDRLYQAGLIKKNFPPDNREQTKANLVRTLQVNPSIVRATLDQFVSQDTGAAEAKVMLDRLDGLSQEKEPEYEYAVSIITLTGQRQFWTKPSPGRQVPNGQSHDTALHYVENRNMDVCAVGTAVFSRIPVVQSVHPFSRNS